MTTVSTQFIHGMPCLVPNKTTDAKSKEDYYVSYNNWDVGIYGSDTTALVLGQMQRFYVLNGNHTKALNDAANFQECLKYLHDNADKLNKFSGKLPEMGSEIAAILSVRENLLAGKGLEKYKAIK